MPEPPADAGDDAPEQGSNSLLLTITGPFLNFLAMHKLENPGEQRKLENPGKLEALKMTFWPFAVAGGFLFGLGIAGGNAFMSGKIEQAALEAAEPVQDARSARRGLRRELAGGKTASKQAPADGAAAGGKMEAPISPEHRRAALRTATAALGLGTLLACTGAAVCVKVTCWYLEVNTAEEFAREMRKRLPAGMASFAGGVRLEERRAALEIWFRDSLGVGAWVEKQERDRRQRAEKAAQEQLAKNGSMTPAEVEAEKARVEAEALSSAGPVAKARGLVRRTTGL